MGDARKFFPTKHAIVCGAERIDWATFNARMNRVANALLRMGIGKGKRVAVVMSNSVDMFCTMYGIIRAGACVVPLSGLLTSDQLHGLLTDSRSCLIVADAGGAKLIAPIQQRLAGTTRDDGFILAGERAAGWQSYQEWLGNASTDQPRVVYGLDDEFNITYSSGTTGLPKGIVQSHRARQHWSYSNALEMRFHANCRALTTTALYSNGTGLMTLPALFVGGTVHVLPAFDPELFLKTVQAERITHTFMVPTQFIVTLAHDKFNNYDLSSLETMLSAGSSLRDDTKREVLERMGRGLYELYGTSEGLATMIKPYQHEGKFGSVGTPVIGFDIRIIGEDDKELPRGGGVGEIVGYGAGMMLCYNNQPDKTAELIWRDERNRTYIRTGDMGEFDKDGFLFIRDRKKDMIISGGFNVFPTDIEAVFGAHAAVMDVAVIGVPHAKWGETPMALLVLNPGNDGADVQKIMAECNAKLSKPQRVSSVEVRPDFPRNALGKVLKKELREPFWRGQQSKL